MNKTLIYLSIGMILLVGTLIYITATDSGARSAGTMVNATSPSGTVEWTNPTYANSSDNVYATVTVDEGESHFLKATNFGFDIPTGATINGILVEIEGMKTGLKGLSVKIIKNNNIVGSYKDMGFTTSEAYYSAGSSSDLWGQNWTVDDINSSNFGIALIAYDSFSEGSTTIFVDHIRITVYYTEAGGGGILSSQVRIAGASHLKISGTNKLSVRNYTG